MRRRIAAFLLAYPALSCHAFVRPRPTPPPARLPSALAARKGAMARRKKHQSSSDAASDSDDGRGFGSKGEAGDGTAEPGSIYSMPPLYDLAFGYRDYGEEVDFLLESHRRHTSPNASDDGDTGPVDVLELAAGPARHSLSALSEHDSSEVRSATALDLSPDMVKYGLENADAELGTPGGGRRDDFSYVTGDMRRIADSTGGKEFDTAWLLLGSMQHLLTNDDVLSCLTSVHSALRTGGTMVIELPHPRETFSMGECTRNGWTVPLVEDDGGGDEREYGELKIVWGDDGDDFDPIAQVRRFTVGLELTVEDGAEVPEGMEGKSGVREVVPMRLFTMQEIDALARCAGFEVADRHGALEDGVPIDGEDEAFRMVCTLCKV